MASTRWFYVESGQQRGPIDSEALVDLLRSDKLPPNTLVWRSGRDGWSRADAVAEIAAKIPPPLPHTASSFQPITETPPPLPQAVAAMTVLPAFPGQDPPAIPRLLSAMDSSDRAARVAKWLAACTVLLLVVDVGGWAYLLSRPMKDAAKAAESLGALIARLAFLSAIVTAVVPPLRRRFLVSVLLLFALPMTLFLGVVTYGRVKNDRLAGQLIEFGGFTDNLLERVKTGEGGLPKPLSPDNPMAGIQAFVTELAAVLDSMEKEVQAVGAVDIFDLDLLASGKKLAAQLEARRRQRQILQSYLQTVLAKIDSWQSQPSAVGLSDETRADMERGARGAIARGRVAQQQMFALRLRAVESEKRFLEFMLRTVGEYRISSGKLQSPNELWSQSYRMLSHAVLDVRKEEREYAASQMEQAERELQKIKELTGAR